MANLRFARNLADHLSLTEGDPNLVAHPAANQSLKNAQDMGALQQQMVPQHAQMQEVVNAQAPYPSQSQLQQQMAGGPRQHALNVEDQARNGGINAAARDQISAGNQYLSRFIMPLTPDQGAVVSGGLEAVGRMQQRNILRAG